MQLSTLVLCNVILEYPYMAHQFMIKPLRFAVVQALARQYGRDDECITSRYAEIRDVYQPAALPSITRLQADSPPVFNPACNVLSM